MSRLLPRRLTILCVILGCIVGYLQSWLRCFRCLVSSGLMQCVLRTMTRCLWV